MIEVSQTCVLPVAQERVWDLLTDVRRYADWVVGTDEVLDVDGPVREGAVYRERNPVLGPWKTRTSWRVQEFVAPRRQVHVSDDFPLSRRTEVILELAPEGEGTRFTLTLRGQPALGAAGAAAGRLMRPRIARDNRRTVANFAELVRRDG